MKRARLVAAVAAFALAAGACHPSARGGIGDWLQDLRKRWVVLTYDLLVEPGKAVSLRASLRTGFRFDGIEAKRLRFYLDKQFLGERVTDDDGDAAIEFAVPEKPGDYRIRVGLHPDDQPEKTVSDATLLVAARRPDAPIAIVDLDKTVVASSFAYVLVGKAKPMPDSASVLRRLDKDHTIVYLTHRPDFLSHASKTWLRTHGFPRGPVLTSTLAGMVEGSGTFKTERLAALRQTFQKIQIGIGDKFSDAQAYARNGMRSVLILPVDWSEDDPEDYEEIAEEVRELPASVQIVSDWKQVSGILFRDETYPRDRMLERLRSVARRLRQDDDDDDEDEEDDD